MDNRKVLLFAVLVILLALVGLNFKGITGKQLGGDVIIELSPTTMDCRRQDNSKVINVFVDAGSIGVDKTFYMHRADDESRVGGSSDTLCSQSICSGAHNTNYRLSCGLGSGGYFFRFTRDNYDRVFNSEVFTLTHSG